MQKNEKVLSLTNEFITINSLQCKNHPLDEKMLAKKLQFLQRENKKRSLFLENA